MPQVTKPWENIGDYGKNDGELGHGSMSRLVTEPSFRYFAHWKSDVRQRWQFFTILKTNAATIFFLATLPVVLRTVLGSAISANCASKTERHAVSSEG